ncbi:MAG: cupin domain-containing protein [Chelatococcus sp.]|uniref:cupin domain-containing protein n=1 Tax=unclassified Chelatococcus TaxID=2638111 RepID=UPI001BD10ABE|nr:MULTISPECIES: cupin domain-containing protein [unclassified Chelatococcus]CAH1653510.1 putative Cupin_2 domain-containing protein [Hyphomicrobiales bacterium]MBS7742893.1 cupin domain-containing protein [Chelatococcus sp. HY11]MBX3540783.1 cupin domain-containing protein [Chelatococcus sp.]MBX3541989.1 cupin domain-containing protein [Chelatococcus sp.]MCO5074119.1 cupin domain-containing protein [Chelatococcus sp.]
MPQFGRDDPSYDIADLRDYDLPPEAPALAQGLFRFNGINLRHCVIENGATDWLRHVDSDALFQVLDGELLVDLRLPDDAGIRNIVVKAGQVISIHAGVEHRTYSHGRAVLLVMDALAA